MKEQQKKKAAPVLVVLILIVLVGAAGVVSFLINRYKPGTEYMAGNEYFNLTDENSVALIRKRNRNMAARAAGLLAGGNAFIAVGALHLPGGEGLVELIRQAGYKVTPVN